MIERRWKQRVGALAFACSEHAGRRAGYLMLLVLLVGCGSRSGASSGPKPIAECEEYERVFARCSGQKVAISSQPAAMPSSEAERERVKALCIHNLDRLKEACR